MAKPTPIRYALRAFCSAFSLALFAIGIWGHVNAQILDNARPTGFGWVAKPIAQFLLWLTNGGDVTALLIVSVLLGVFAYRVTVFIIFKTHRRPRSSS